MAFNSAATNLVPNDTNGYADTFVRDFTQRISIGAQGQQGNRDAGDHAISGDGGTIAIQTAAWDLIPGVINLGTNIFVHQRSDRYAPRFGEQPGDLSAHPGDSVVFAASAAANPAPAFQ